MGGVISEQLSRWKQGIRVKAARKEVLGRSVESVPHGLNAPLVVSLTSYAARFPSLALTLRSLLSQAVRPDRVVLWLDAGDQEQLPPAVRALDIEIRTCPNWRCYKKIIPTLMEWPDAYVVTADDDLYYQQGWLGDLVANASAGVVAHRAHRITFGADGAIRPYSDWQRNIPSPETGPLIFPTGVGGVLYAPGVFYPDITREDLFQRLAPGADDIWLYWMHRLAGSRPAKIGGKFRITEWPGTQQSNLRSQNLAGDGNDRAIAAMMDHYGFPE